MLSLKAGAIGSTLGLAELAVNPIAAGEKLGQLGAAAILGVVAVACVIGIIYLYKVQLRKDDQHTDKLYKLIEQGTQAAQANADASKTQAAILVEVKDAIRGCLKHSGRE